MYRLSLDKIDLAFEKIAASLALYLPQDNSAGDSEYKKWEKGAKWSEALNTVRSPKDFFFPQTDDLVEFKVSGKNIEIIDTRRESEDFVIFGVRACDVKSFDILDRVFLQDVPDSYYASRREHAIIVSVACTRPTETCFCHTFGIDKANPEGDVTCHKTTDSLYLSFHTEKGEKLLHLIHELVEPCEGDEVDRQIESIRKIEKKLPLASLDASSFGGEKTKEFFDAPEWKTLSEACLGCGTCTFVCPTCQCYDIKDLVTASGVIRYRCWDSCMYSEFTKMSAGQPRLSQLERFRQRFMHKLVYYPENNDGLFSCVGCGRCLGRCPIQMNIVKVMKALGGKDDE